MQKILILLAMALLVVEVNAQTLPSDGINLERYNKYRKLQQPIPQPKSFSNPRMNQLFVNVEKAYTVPKGDVYILPQDNMPMLKAFVESNTLMPYSKQTELDNSDWKAGKIPNSQLLQQYQFLSNGKGQK